ncbi:hypothetical protein MUK42_37650 [Musa troglodytarum]|uniref:Uncharacterized protein n=1 Tax=Musa troglodytarum TaxID=320322 RepID=A0A9E7HN83_9LILI|nr:hypothetical protein MUK42_37650 [Musa troglodytarum]
MEPEKMSLPISSTTLQPTIESDDDANAAVIKWGGARSQGPYARLDHHSNSSQKELQYICRVSDI